VPFDELKHVNFVPSCDKNAKFRCSKCKTIWFCDDMCQKAAWKIHKKHWNDLIWITIVNFLKIHFKNNVTNNIM
jgi:hypothetical protein